MIERREVIPIPCRLDDAPGDFIRLSVQTELKLRLYLALRESGRTRADLQRRLGWQRESVDRLFRLDHRSRIGQLEEAFRALDQVVDIDVRPSVKVA